MMRGVAMMWGWAGRGWTLLTLLTALTGERTEQALGGPRGGEVCVQRNPRRER